MLVPLFSGELVHRGSQWLFMTELEFFKGRGEEMNSIAKFDNQIPDNL